jgi:ATP-dependent DNA helicase RecG
MASKKPQWAKVLKSLEIDRLSQALLIAPIDCVDLRAPVLEWGRVKIGSRAFLRGKVDAIEFQNSAGVRTSSPYPARAHIEMRDGTGTVYVMKIFGAKEWRRVSGGAIVDMVATVSEFHGKRQIQFESFVVASGFVLPRYAGVRGMVSGDRLRLLVHKALANDAAIAECANEIAAYKSSSASLRQFGYRSPRDLLLDLHRPQTPEKCALAIRAAKVLSLRALAESAQVDFGAAEPVSDLLPLMRDAAQSWPQAPSPSQRKALGRLAAILGGNRSTRNLLLGDVGSGKTRVFLTPVVAMARAGRRCAILAPNAPVAQQIFAQIREIWPDVSAGLCTASLRETQSLVLVGTTALLSEVETMGERLAILVVDEQQKFSVGQRTLPVDHVIEATATPIPRTLALADAGGWNLVTIEQSAIQRELTTHLFQAEDRPLLQRMAADHLRAGRRVVFVYPVVKDKDNSAMTAHARLDAHFSSAGGALLLHGRMKEADKLDAVAQFKAGTSRVLVCTTAVEVGLDVPGIGLLAVMSADNYGVSQLHQLRGRLARDGGVGDFVMYVGGDRDASDRALSRLRSVLDCGDGLSLARRDVATRGVGSLLGDAQSGKVRSLFIREKIGLEELRAARQAAR